MSQPNVAILVLNRNMKAMTQALIDTIRKTTVKHTLFVLDADSDSDQIVWSGDVMIRFKENLRWAWSFARGMEIATSKLSHITGMGQVYETDDGVEYTLDASVELADYTHFWLLCNDTQLDPNQDTLNILLANMPADACQIHPYQLTHPKNSPQGQSGGTFVAQFDVSCAHNVSFVEFVCPLITREFYDACLAKFGMPPVNPEFPYGWGVDYEMAFFGHELKMKSYICDAVGISHHPGTTHLASATTKVEDNNTMRVLARNSMLNVLEHRHGRNWGEKFAVSARAAGVDPKAFLDWSQHDRALALKGARV